MRACVLSHFSCVQLYETLRTAAHQALLSVGIIQARILEWVAMPSSRASSRPRDQTHISCLLHWQVGSLPLALPGKPQSVLAPSIIIFPNCFGYQTRWYLRGTKVQPAGGLGRLTLSVCGLGEKRLRPTRGPSPPLGSRSRCLAGSLMSPSAASAANLFSWETPVPLCPVVAPPLPPSPPNVRSLSLVEQWSFLLLKGKVALFSGGGGQKWAEPGQRHCKRHWPFNPHCRWQGTSRKGCRLWPCFLQKGKGAWEPGLALGRALNTLAPPGHGSQ